MRLRLAGTSPRRSSWSGSEDGAGAKISEIALGHLGRGVIVGHSEVHNSVSLLHVDRADIAGGVDTEPAALDHRRAAHADTGILGRDHHVTAPQQRRVAGKAVSGGDS